MHFARKVDIRSSSTRNQIAQLTCLPHKYEVLWIRKRLVSFAYSSVRLNVIVNFLIEPDNSEKTSIKLLGKPKNGG